MDTGHPDYYWLLKPDFGGYIEAKWVKDRFPFSRIKENQREWLNGWPESSWFWLWMGDDVRGAGGSLRRRAWLIPWPDWLEVEAHAQQHDLVSLPYDREQAHFVAEREHGLSAVELLARHELEWAGNGRWSFPAAHPFRIRYGAFFRPVE
mgnify:CR=1 FL=1